MATKTEYNSLLKKGFQDINDTSAIETEISNLQRDITAAQELITTLQSLLETLQGNVTTVQNNVTTLQGNVTTVQNNVTTLQTSTAKLQANKITKCASSAKLADLTDGEIFQWQAADTADFKNGYFYAVAKTELPVGSSYYQYPSGQQTIIQNGYNFAPGNYYVISEPDVEGSNFSDYRLYQYRNTEYYVVLTSNQTLAVGDTVWDEANKLSLTVTAIDGSNVTLSNGATFSKDSSTGSSFTTIYNCKNAAGEDFTIIQTGVGKMVVHYTLSNNIFTLLDFFTVGFLFLWETTSPISIAAYTQTNTQPPTPGVTVSDGVLQISLPVEFSGNITVHGSEVVVTTEQIKSEKDYIKLRHNNPLALAAGETSGISVNNYDGNNTDCILAVDKDGWARVGDSSGTLEKIATIEESPTDGAFVKYNNTTKELESTTDGSNLTATYTPNNTVNRNNINSGVTFAELAQYLNSLFLSCQHPAQNYMLFADATSQYVVAPTNNRVGFVGVVITERVYGNTTLDTSCNLIAVVYSTSQSCFSCSANNNILLPVLVSYQNKIYCALKFTNQLSKYIHFVGIRQGEWLEVPISTNDVTIELITGTIFS